MTQTITLPLDAARDLAAAALVASGTAPGAAETVARALVRAEADGQRGHGLSRVPFYAAQARAGKVNGAATPELRDLRPGLFRVDAGHGFAYPALARAIPELAARAKTQGIAACAITHSHHFGVAGHHCEDLADLGVIGFVYGNAPKSLAPWGAKAPLLGTNPIAFAAPMEPAPLVVDLAVTTVAKGKIMAAARTGAPIPEGWALDAEGRPTTDPVAAMAGTMAPMGGAKGAALALMVEVMSACLVGSALSAEASSLFDTAGGPPDLGQCLIAIDAEALSGGVFAERIATLAGLYDEIGARLPGTRRLAAREKAAREGLTLETGLIEEITSIGKAAA
ncbi:MAG: sulfolactate dehydrogenase [Rhodovulum sulfidophilum]|uniref:Sulfolactate dehydrogenase n=1 Tax=Rhodovulum sulfidophilum TaxID=35806 RepID=A0A2W5NE02_RHOSU|nr:MAG: sulfolactate dehydrogenase [Rhodovulum sulfidophilum]